MSKGAWGAALSGLGEGLQRAAPMIYNSWREEEARKWQSVRDEYLAELRHKYSMAELGEREQMAIRAEDRQRAPYQRAAQATTSLINSAARLDEDAAGNITRTEPGTTEQARIRAGAYENEGLHDAASRLRTEALSAERLELERSNLFKRERQDERQHQERMTGLNRQLAIAEKQLARTYGLDKPQSTALTTNIQFMIENGVAVDAADAFNKLHTRMSASPEQAVNQFATTLLRSGDPRYRGEQGRLRAADDAKAMVGRIRAMDDEEFERRFQGGPSGPASAAPAFSLGGKTISQSDLEFTARKYGISVDEVKRRLGVR